MGIPSTSSSATASCAPSCSLPSFLLPWPGPLPRIAGVSASLRLCWLAPPPPQQQQLLTQAQVQQQEKRPPSPASLVSDSSPTTGACLALDFSVGIRNQQQLLSQRPQLPQRPQQQQQQRRQRQQRQQRQQPPPPQQRQLQQPQRRQHLNVAVCLVGGFSALK